MNIGSRYIIKFCFLLLFSVMCCSVLAQNNGETVNKGFTTPTSKPPEPFNLLAPENDTQLILDAIFLWEEAIDPEGGKVTYRFVVSQDPEFQTIDYDQRNITETFTILSLRFVSTLKPGVVYYWKIIATDPAGESTESNQTFQFVLAQLAGNITLQVFVRSLQSNAVLASAQVIAKNQPTGDIINFPGTFNGARVGIAAIGAVLDITAMEPAYSTNTMTGYNVNVNNPQSIDIYLNCLACDSIFTNQFEGL